MAADTPTPSTPAPGAPEVATPALQDAARDSALLRAPLALAPATRRRMARYLRAYARTGIVLDGVKAAGISRSCVETWRARHPFFAIAEAEAREAAADELERHLHKRATRGYQQAVFGRDGVIGYKRVMSDNLLMFALKGARPGKYKEKEIGDADLVTLLARVRNAAERVRGDALAAAQRRDGERGDRGGGVIETTAHEVTTAHEIGTLGAAGPGAAGPDESDFPALPLADTGARPLRPGSLLAAVYAGARSQQRTRVNVPRETLGDVPQAPQAPQVTPATPAPASPRVSTRRK